MLLAVIIAVVFLGCFLHYGLMGRDRQLPPDQKYMTLDMYCSFWALYLLAGVIGGLIFYLIVTTEMDVRLKRIHIQQTASQVPVQVAIEDQK